MTGLLKILASKRLYMNACWALRTQQHWPLRELVLRNLMWKKELEKVALLTCLDALEPPGMLGCSWPEVGPKMWHFSRAPLPCDTEAEQSVNNMLSSQVLNLKSVMKDAITAFSLILKLRSTPTWGKLEKMYIHYVTLLNIFCVNRASLVAQRLNLCLQCGRPGFNPWVGKIPWRRKWQPTPVFLPGESHERRSLVGYSPWGCKESDMTEWLHFHFLSHSHL